MWKGDPAVMCKTRSIARSAFTVIELLVVISIIGLLFAILIPSLRGARNRAKDLECLTNLRLLGQGWQLYAADNRSLAVPARLPPLFDGGEDNERNYYEISTGMKYRPRWPALMQVYVGEFALRKPKTSRSRQDYSSEVYVCPDVSSWDDERNAAYGYNYQFLGSHRRSDETERVRNLPVFVSKIRATADTLLIADSLGTAAAFPKRERSGYSNGGDDPTAKGNSGWLIDPPKLERTSSRAATYTARSAPHERHNGRAHVVFVDGHVEPQTLEDLGYEVADDGAVKDGGEDAHNRKFSGTGRDVPPR